MIKTFRPAVSPDVNVVDNIQNLISRQTCGKNRKHIFVSEHDVVVLAEWKIDSVCNVIYRIKAMSRCCHRPFIENGANFQCVKKLEY